jgi:hypothetical protein
MVPSSFYICIPLLLVASISSERLSHSIELADLVQAQGTTDIRDPSNLPNTSSPADDSNVQCRWFVIQGNYRCRCRPSNSLAPWLDYPDDYCS